MNMKTGRIIVWLSALLVAGACAELQLNGLFSDNMVLQRNQQVPVWGMAEPGADVTVEFAGQKEIAAAKPDGSWMVYLEPMTASSTPAKMIVSSSASKTPPIHLSNLLIGDVWLCGGQSNMASLMKNYLVWNRSKKRFLNEQVRFFKLKHGGVGSSDPTKALVVDPFFKDSWQSCTPEFSAQFSATAGFFGMKLQRDTGVPVGLLSANRGGTQCNMWLPREVLDANPDYKRFLDASNKDWKPSKKNPAAIRAPSHLYNGTIYPLAPFAIRGVIWYQGESDSNWPELYADLFSDVIESWRKLWGYDFPFLFVQLAPWGTKTDEDPTGENWAWLRDAQFQCLENVPNCGMVVMTDAGEKADIHPQAKKVPGERLALLAQSLDGDNAKALFPSFGELKVKDGRAYIKFKNVSGGLETRRVALNTIKKKWPGKDPAAVVSPTNELKGFTLCGADRHFVEASAKIISEDVIEVFSSAITKPIAVRYGWKSFPVCNLYGGNGQPTVPFRTDDFPALKGSDINP